MDNILLQLRLWFAVVTGTFCALLGGWDIWLYALLFFVIADFITGILKSLYLKSEKSETGGLNSTVMFRGGIKKVLVFVIVAVATVADKAISPDNTFIRSIVIMYYVATEGLSILENIGACGVTYPKKLQEVLEKVKSDNEK